KYDRRVWERVWVGGYYHTALQAAATSGNRKCVELLLEHHVNVNSGPGGVHGTALQAAAATGHDDVVRVLLEKQADPNINALEDAGECNPELPNDEDRPLNTPRASSDIVPEKEGGIPYLPRKSSSYFNASGFFHGSSARPPIDDVEKETPEEMQLVEKRPAINLKKLAKVSSPSIPSLPMFN
ncbi:hypothetical protein S40293_07886, partial [Stachybotrys chartarum IBT 40293]